MKNILKRFKAIVEFTVLLTTTAGIIIYFVSSFFFDVKNETFMRLVIGGISTILLSSILERYGVLSEIKRKLESPNTNNISLKTRGEIERDSLGVRLANAIEVNVVSLSGIVMLDHNRGLIETIIENNDAHINLVFIEPSSMSQQLSCKFYIRGNDTNTCQDSIGAYKARNEYLDKINKRDHLKIKMIDAPLPYAIMIVRNDKKHKNDNHIKIDYYSFNTKDECRKSFIIYENDKNNTDNYKFYEDQWKYIWENMSKPISEYSLNK